MCSVNLKLALSLWVIFKNVHGIFFFCKRYMYTSEIILGTKYVLILFLSFLCKLVWCECVSQKSKGKKLSPHCHSVHRAAFKRWFGHQGCCLPVSDLVVTGGDSWCKDELGCFVWLSRIPSLPSEDLARMCLLDHELPAFPSLDIV